MWTFYKVLLFGILQGLCILVDGNTETLYRTPGSSLDLFLKYPKAIVLSVEWKFNGDTFAEYTSGSNVSPVTTRFSRRLKLDQEKVGVTVQDLQLQHSGMFSVVTDGHQGQLGTHMFQVYIQNPITIVKIETNKTWLVSTNSCVINVMCEAPGGESVSYRWSGYKDADGAQINFSLSQEEEIRLNCTAVNNVSTRSALERLTCTGDLPLMYIGIAAAGAVCVLVLIIALICRRKRDKGEKTDESTVYADVNPANIAGKDERPDFPRMTIYETVDDVKADPAMTIYAKVTLPQDAMTKATTSSPYHQIKY